jgi:hypothetical protein
MLEIQNLERTPLKFFPGDTVTIEGMLVAVVRVYAESAFLIRVEGNCRSFPVSMVLESDKRYKVSRSVYVP